MSKHHHHQEGLSCSCCSPLWESFLKNSLQVNPLKPSENKAPQKQLTDMIFITKEGGTIQTLKNGENTEVEAIGIKNGKIHAVGSLEEVCIKMPENIIPTPITGSQIMLPGFIEPHVHIAITAAMDNFLDVGPFDGQYLKEDYTRETIADKLQNSERKPSTKLIDPTTDLPSEWYIGQQMDPSLLQGNKEFNANFLDNNVSDKHPVFLLSGSLHTAYINTKAIKLLKSSDYNGPEINENGELQELAQMIPVMEYLPVPERSEIEDKLHNIIDTAAERGVTYMLDAGIYPKHIPYYEEFFADQKVRLAGAVISDSLADLNDNIIDKFQPNTGDENFNLAYLKLVSDGSNQGLTGYQENPYSCNGNFEEFNLKDQEEIHQQTNTGIFNFGYPLEFNALLTTANNYGWPVMVHANGDKAIERTINSFKAAGVTKKSRELRRDRIEHCSLLTDQHLKGMEDLGISPSFLIGHVGYWGWIFQSSILGQERSNHLDRCRSALDHNMKITMHSDLGVSPLGPLRMMEQSITRLMEGAPKENQPVVLNSNETITPFQALKAMTYDAAWQCHADKWVGSLEVGKYADFVILNQSPLTYKNNNSAYTAKGMRDIQILETWKGGEQTYPHKVALTDTELTHEEKATVNMR